MIITNFDELKRLHDHARVATVGSKEWIEFATTMLDSWPGIYQKGRELNKDFARLTWLNEQPVSFIELDNFTIIDVKGNDVRTAIDEAMQKHEGI